MIFDMTIMCRSILCVFAMTIPALTWAQPASGTMAGMFQQYDVRPSDVPAAFKLTVQQKYACDPTIMKSGFMGFQLSEESAVWQILCHRLGSQTTAAYTSRRHC